MVSWWSNGFIGFIGFVGFIELGDLTGPVEFNPFMNAPGTFS
jgi:hypothetical protein